MTRTKISSLQDCSKIWQLESLGRVAYGDAGCKYIEISHFCFENFPGCHATWHLVHLILAVKLSAIAKQHALHDDKDACDAGP